MNEVQFQLIWLEIKKISETFHKIRLFLQYVLQARQVMQIDHLFQDGANTDIRKHN